MFLSALSYGTGELHYIELIFNNIHNAIHCINKQINLRGANQHWCCSADYKENSFVSSTSDFGVPEFWGSDPDIKYRFFILWWFDLRVPAGSLSSAGLPSLIPRSFLLIYSKTQQLLLLLWHVERFFFLRRRYSFKFRKLLIPIYWVSRRVIEKFFFSYLTKNIGNTGQCPPGVIIVVYGQGKKHIQSESSSRSAIVRGGYVLAFVVVFVLHLRSVELLLFWWTLIANPDL